MKTFEATQKLFGDLGSSVWAHATITAAAESGVLELLVEPRTLTFLSQRTEIQEKLIESMLDVLVALSLVRRDGDSYVAEAGFQPFLVEPASRFLRANLCAGYLQSWQFLQNSKAGDLAPGWRHTNAEILQAQGNGSEMAAQRMKNLMPLLEGLEERMQAPSAAFLDVGTGVGGLAIALCRFFPNLHAVGLDPADAALAAARCNVADANLTDRIELRQQRVEDMTDCAAFDFAWLPHMFLPLDVVKRGLRSVRTALRPGGWVLLVADSAPGMELELTVARLRNVVWGGDRLSPEPLAELVTKAGFKRVQVLPPLGGLFFGLPGTMLRPVVGQRPA